MNGFVCVVIIIRAYSLDEVIEQGVDLYILILLSSTGSLAAFLVEFLHLYIDTTYKSKSKAQSLYELLELQSLRSKSDRYTR